MLHVGWPIKKWTDQRPPFHEQVGTAKPFGMVFQTGPTNQQDIPGGYFNAVLELVPEITFGLADYPLGSLEIGFEFGIAAGFDVDGGNFENHVFVFLSKIGKNQLPQFSTLPSEVFLRCLGWFK